jgi:two-component system, cell cycle sensor histidine kinase and response regulator CckA
MTAVSELGSSRPAAAPQGTKTILVVEDEAPVRRLIEMVLEDSGYSVLAVEQGAEAIALSEDAEQHIDLLVADINLPDMNGRELAQRVRVNRPEMKLLYMSGYGDTAVTEWGIVPDGMLFLSKPFSPSVLAAKVRELLDA